MRCFALIVGVILLTACGGRDQRVVAREQVIAGQFDDARRTVNDTYHHHLSEFGDKKAAISGSRHLLLWRLERGAIAQSAGDDGEAIEHLTEASRLAREARTRSVARAISASVVNDNMTRWSGESAEIIRIPAQGLLAHLDLMQRADGTLPGKRDADAAALHSDRVASASLALEDQLERLAEGEFGSGVYQDDGWLHLLASVGRFITAGSNDDLQGARLAADRAVAAFAKEGATPAVAERLIARIRGTDLLAPDHGSILVLEEAGFVALRQALQMYVVTAAPAGNTSAFDVGGLWVYVDGPGKEQLEPLHGMLLPGWLVRKLTHGQFGVFGCEIPVMPALRARVPLGRVGVAGQTVPLEAVDDVLGDVQQCFMDGQKARVLAIIVRTAGKLIAARQGARAVENSGNEKNKVEREAIGQVLWLLFSAAVTASEQADTRCWSQLPGRVGAALIDLPAGKHTVAVQGADGSAATIGPVTVRAGQIAVVVTRSYPGGTGVTERKR
jgi:hypothetical protein